MAAMPELRVEVDYQAVTQLMAGHIADCASRSGDVSILEAGCGQKWPFTLDGIDYVLTGVDVSAEALELRKTVRKDLDRAILGDLRTLEFDAGSFDIIYSSFVLEHVDGAEEVLKKLVDWVKPGGILVLRFPDRDSVYGFLTRIAPFWLHVAYKRYLRGNPNAGKPGYDPFPTYHDRVIGRAAFRSFAGEQNLEIVEEIGFDHAPAYQRMLMRVLGLLTLGRLSGRHAGLMYVCKFEPSENTDANR